ncbi:hypothetical protein EUA06_18325 [Nocardioides glacieisoli]|uniref:GTPase-associated system helical domain-containing protein n=1 Tax=Nocardioides glacieisoli TaxID=1168730 RepID=A0A4Q2RKV4_9ACTN|nr:hypothetical protein [Nocardioides glacieisoli]RYB89058.1 hypothetical protein EUA06_18325 [Nocardioides glacieisoli]
MHAMFPDWMRAINPDDDVTAMPLESWWDAIVEFVDDADPDRVVDLCRAAHERPTAAFDERWRQHLKEHDAVSPLRERNRQIAVLAGAALVYATESGPHPHVAQYARRCASHASWEPALRDVAFSGADLHEFAMQARSLAEWPATRKVSVTTRNVADHLPAAEAGVSGANLKAVVDALAVSVAEAVSRSANATVKVAAERERVLLEQSDTLVWLLGGHSNSLGVAWKELSPLTAAVCAALEIRDISKFVLGRPDAPALIDQAVASAGKPSKTKTSSDQLALLLSEHISAIPDTAAELAPLCNLISSRHDLDLEPTDVGVRLHDELGLLYSMPAAK